MARKARGSGYKIDRKDLKGDMPLPQPRQRSQSDQVASELRPSKTWIYPPPLGDGLFIRGKMRLDQLGKSVCGITARNGP